VSRAASNNILAQVLRARRKSNSVRPTVGTTLDTTITASVPLCNEDVGALCTLIYPEVVVRVVARSVRGVIPSIDSPDKRRVTGGAANYAVPNVWVGTPSSLIPTAVNTDDNNATAKAGRVGLRRRCSRPTLELRR